MKMLNFSKNPLLYYFIQQRSDLTSPFLDHLIQAAFPRLLYADAVSSVWLMTSF